MSHTFGVISHIGVPVGDAIFNVTSFGKDFVLNNGPILSASLIGLGQLCFNNDQLNHFLANAGITEAINYCAQNAKPVI